MPSAKHYVMLDSPSFLIIPHHSPSFLIIPHHSSQALTEIAKKRQRTGFLSVFNDSQIQSYQSESHGDDDAASQPYSKTVVSPGLYETKEVVDESGRRVMETAV